MNKLPVLMIVCAVVAGCNVGDESSGDPLRTLETDFMVLDKFDQPSTTFMAGEEIRLKLVMRNPNPEDITVYYSLPGYDLAAYDAAEEMVWDVWYGDGGYPVYPAKAASSASTAMDIKEFPLRAGETWVRIVAWTGEDNENVLLPAGEYRIEPELSFWVEDEYLEVPEPDSVTVTLN